MLSFILRSIARKLTRNIRAISEENDRAEADRVQAYLRIPSFPFRVQHTLRRATSISLRLSNQASRRPRISLTIKGPFTQHPAVLALVCAQSYTPRYEWKSSRMLVEKHFRRLSTSPFSNSACRAFISFEIVAVKREANFNEVGGPTVLAAVPGRDSLRSSRDPPIAIAKSPRPFYRSDG